jgi:tetratricopeptide (TPR) repeat protein
VRGLLDGAIAHARGERPRAALDACEDALSAAPTDPEVHATLAWLLERDGRHVAAREKRALIERYLDVLDDPPGLDARAFEAEGRADIPVLLEVAEAHARQGRLVTALDTCYAALALAPAEPAVHLAIARIRLALGWRRRAIDGSSRLARLLELTGDEGGRAALAGFVGRELGSAPGPVIRPG